MKSTTTFFALVLLCLPTMAQEQFTNNGNFKIYPNASIAFFGDIINNGFIEDSCLLIAVAGSAPQTIGGSSITTFNNVQLENGTGITLSQAMRIRGMLTLTSGILTTSNSNILIMQNGSQVEVGNCESVSYINGPMRYQKSSLGSTTLNFPIGKFLSCRPITLTVNHASNSLYNYQAESFNLSASALGYTLPETVDRVSNLSYSTIVRTDSTESLSPSFELVGSQIIKMYYGMSDSVIDGNALTVCKNSIDIPNTWFDIGGAGGSSYNGGAYLSGSITSTSSPSDFINFSTFTLGNTTGGMNPLPIELFDFNVKRCDEEMCVNLLWQTASEFNSSHFTIEHATDGIHYETIGKKDAAGHSHHHISYVFTDTNPSIGVNYYRLKQFDNTGNSSYLGDRLISLSKAIGTVRIYPNPFSTELYLLIGIDAIPKDTYQFRVFDVLGTEVMNKILPIEKSKIETAHLKPGIYLYQLTDLGGNHIQSGKLVSQH